MLTSAPACATSNHSVKLCCDSPACATTQLGSQQQAVNTMVPEFFTRGAALKLTRTPSMMAPDTLGRPALPTRTLVSMSKPSNLTSTELNSSPTLCRQPSYIVTVMR